jgi:hypothetical protein
VSGSPTRAQLQARVDELRAHPLAGSWALLDLSRAEEALARHDRASWEARGLRGLDLPSMPLCCALIRNRVAPPRPCRCRAPLRVRRPADGRWFYFCKLHRSVAERVQAGGEP